MNDFAFTRAADAAAALRLAATADTTVIAGGTELLNWMRLGIAAPARVLDIGAADEWRGIRAERGQLWIGALTTLADTEASADVRRLAPALAEACLRAASPQIRNRATLGGNVLQKTRCAYFRADAPLPWPCNKREPGSGCAALDGAHERHAILGWTRDCAATQPSDPVVALACLDAIAELRGPQGARTLPVAQLLLSQQEAAAMGGGAAAVRTESRLKRGELITGYRIPLDGAAASAYVKVRERESYEYAMVAAAAAVQVEAGVLRRVRFALGSIAQRPWRLPSAETALVGARADDEDRMRSVIFGALQAEARPLPHNAFKLQLAANAAARALRNAGRTE